MEEKGLKSIDLVLVYGLNVSSALTDEKVFNKSVCTDTNCSHKVSVLLSLAK